MLWLCRTTTLATFFLFIFLHATRSFPQKNNVQNRSSKLTNIPHGIYHNYILNTNVDTDFVLPTDNVPLYLNGKATVERQVLNGLYLPLPFGIPPINIQLTRKQLKGGKLGGDVAKGSESKLLHQYSRIKELCLKKMTKICERALKDYYKARVQQVQDDNSSLQQKLLQVGADAASELFASKQDTMLSSILLDLPGMLRPIYVSAASGNDDSNNVKLSFD